jgi:hypothetical protein
MNTAWQSIPALGDVWQATAMREGVPLRSVALRLADGTLAVYSPIRRLPDGAHAALTALGRPALLVAPNHFHNMGLREYGAAYPDAAVVASARAAPRIAKKSGREVADPARLRAALPSHADLLIPPATRAGELWLSIHGPGARAWVVGDALFNIARTPLSVMGLILKAMSISPGLRIGSSFRWLLADRAAYREWLLARLADERPTMLIPCHGDIIADAALPERLREVVEKRL